MLVHLQFPIVDLRGLAGEDSRLPVPNWPSPLQDEEFIRSAGMIRKRLSGGLQGWTAEELYCDARRSIRFVPGGHGSQDLSARRIRVAFRRFYFDGVAVAKFEVGLAIEGRLDLSNPNALNAVLEHLLSLPVRIGRSKGKSQVCRLVESGRALAALYASSSSKHHASGLSALWRKWKGKPGNPLVVAGTPALFLEAAPWQLNAALLPRRALEIPMKDSELRLFNWRVEIDGRFLPTWAALHPSYVEVADVRKLRLYLLRLNAENQALVRALKAINNDTIKPEPRSAAADVLQNYLNNATANILHLSGKTRDFAVGNDRLLSLAAAAAENFLSEEERQSVLAHLKNLQIRKNIFHKIETQESVRDVSDVIKLVDSTERISLKVDTINIGGFHMPNMTQQQQTLLAFVFGVIFIAALLVVIIAIPNPTPAQETVFRIIMALAAAGVGAMIPGVLDLNLNFWSQLALRAGGALAIFVIVFFYNPGTLSKPPAGSAQSAVQAK
jgi:hypothetical protein